MKTIFYLGVACVLGVMSSCSNSDSGTPAASTPATSIGKAGGTVKGDSASVDVPAGALSTPVKISVKQSDVDVAPPDGYTLAGPPIAFTPHGTKFASPVTLTLPYTSSSTQLAVLRLDDEQDTSWEVIDGGQFSRGSATLDVTSFSIYAVAAESAVSGAGGAGGMSSVDATGGVASGVAGANDNGGAPSAAGGSAGGDASVSGGAPATGSGDWSCSNVNGLCGCVAHAGLTDKACTGTPNCCWYYVLTGNDERCSCSTVAAPGDCADPSFGLGMDLKQVAACPP